MTGATGDEQVSPVPATASRIVWALAATAGVLGAAGVTTSAIASHAGGGELTRLAGQFLLVHAAVVLAVAALARGKPKGAAALVSGGGLLAAGTALFSGDLALSGFFGWRPLPAAAPIGGFGMLAGWLVIAGGSIANAIRAAN